MVNDFDAQAANQIPKIIANETVDEVELVRQNNSGIGYLFAGDASGCQS